MVSRPASTAFHRATNSHIDWHDYIEITDQFSPEQRSQLEQSLNELIRIPSFQDILIRSQSPEVLHEWRKLVALAPPPGNIIEQQQFEKYCHPDNKKIYLANAQGTTFNLFDRKGEKTGRVMEAGSRFVISLRVVQINFGQLEQIKARADDSSLYRPSLQHILFHEIDHGSGLTEYRAGIAAAIVAREINKRRLLEGLPAKDAAAMQAMCDAKFERLSEKVIEPRVIADTNAAMKLYDEPVRKGHEGCFIALPNQAYMGNFNAMRLLEDSENTLNLAKDVALSVEEIVKRLRVSDKPPPGLITDIHKGNKKPGPQNLILDSTLPESPPKLQRLPLFEPHRIDRSAMDFTTKNPKKIRKLEEFGFDAEMKIAPPSFSASLPPSFTHKR